ncbi:MAG: NADH-quinone oxidoreductase subunit G [Gammaproteobacteria bacterium]|nr:NADH-quinone oxidoreductase subunit G [Gammaproteobacteria bacterium]
MSDLVNVELDGKKIKVVQGSMIIEAADNNGVYIPRFCYHKKLTVAANCRMCLVEVEKNKKPVPACATPVTEGMKVFTRSELARNAQKAVMEFLLINHPLDCPICDQGGECELQDLAMGFGSDVSRYKESKRVIKDKNLGPFINTEMTRCIYCTRCVRFAQEIAGLPELGTMGRGEHTEISTFVEQAIHSEISGNIIDLCPVGALTSKPFKFSARAWELQQRAAIAPHDCLGSNINFHSLRGVVKRVVPKDNEAINEMWLSDRDRFSYEAINSEQRVTKPLLKRDGQWQEIDWTVALEIIASSFENVKHAYGAEQIAALVSPNSTVEEQFLVQKIMRKFGSNNIDHRLQQTDFRDQASLASTPQLGMPIADLENLDAVLLIGSDIQREQPLAGARLYKAFRNNAAKIMAINPYDFDFNFGLHAKIIAAPAQMVENLTIVSPQVQSIIDHLKQAKHKAIILGALAQNCAQAAELRSLAQHIANLTGATFGELSVGANAAGAWLTGCVPHRSAGGAALNQAGLDANSMFAHARRAYLLFNVDVEFDVADPQQALGALKKADFVVSCSPFVSDAMREYSDVILPIALFAETSGTFINCNGTWQTFAGAIPAQGETRPGWKVLRVLGNFLHLSGFEYNSSEDVKLEVQRLAREEEQEECQLASRKQAYEREKLDPVGRLKRSKLATASEELTRVSYWPMYRSDNIVRRSQPLQEMFALQASPEISISPALAEQLQLHAGDSVQITQDNQQVIASIQVDPKVPAGVVYCAAANRISAQLGNAFGTIQIKKVAT